MDKPQQSDSSDDDKEGAVDLVNPVPNEDGPHDVPDDQVIEKTLPTKGSVNSEDGRPS